MRPDVHQSALKAAAKVAFSVVFLNGCAAQLESQEAAATGSGEGGEQATSEADLSPKKKPLHHVTKTSVTKAGNDAGASCDASPPAPVSCDATLAAEFPKPGDYKWKPEARSTDVVACCVDELKAHEASSKYRWDCCVAYDAADPNKQEVSQRFGGACTPWGPPVPPSAKRLRRVSPEVAAWLMRAVA